MTFVEYGLVGLVPLSGTTVQVLRGLNIMQRLFDFWRAFQFVLLQDFSKGTETGYSPNVILGGKKTFLRSHILGRFYYELKKLAKMLEVHDGSTTVGIDHSIEPRDSSGE